LKKHLSPVKNHQVSSKFYLLVPFVYYAQLFTLLPQQLLQDLDELQVILFDFKVQQLNFDLVLQPFIKLMLVLLLEFKFEVMLKSKL
jgi:hypothetical protein